MSKAGAQFNGKLTCDIELFVLKVLCNELLQVQWVTTAAVAQPLLEKLCQRV